MSDTHLIQVVRYDAGMHDDPKTGTQVDFVAVAGRGQDGQWSKAIMFGAEAAKVEATLREECGPSSGIKGLHVVVCEGRWRTTEVERNGAPSLDRAFVASSIAMMRGPQAEVMLARLDAARALAAADRLRRASESAASPEAKAADLLAAYREIEGFVATFTRQAQPSLTPDADLALAADMSLAAFAVPEEIAKEKFAALDRSRALPAEGASVASSAPREPTVVDAPAEAVVAPTHEPAAVEPGAEAVDGAALNDAVQMEGMATASAAPVQDSQDTERTPEAGASDSASVPRAEATIQDSQDTEVVPDVAAVPVEAPKPQATVSPPVRAGVPGRFVPGRRLVQAPPKERAEDLAPKM